MVEILLGFMLGCIAVMLACMMFVLTQINRNINKRADEIEERKNSLRKKLDAIYPPGYLPGIDPKPEPPKIRERDMW